MDNFAARGHTIVMSDLAASNFYEIEGIRHASTESRYQILVAFFACMYNFRPPSSKAYELSYMKSVFTFIQIEACQKPVHVKIIVITHCAVK